MRNSNWCAVSARKLAVITLLGCIGVLGLFVAMGTSRALAQVRPHTLPTPESGDDQTAALLPAGVESATEATERVRSYKPDPVKYPVPRTSWDRKPDFSGVYWPGVNIAPPPVPLESLYRPDVREYREGGGGAPGLIDWRGIDTPGYHCWPPSPTTGSMALTFQLVSVPGFLLMLNEGGGAFRIIPIVGETGRPQDRSRRPSFQGSSVGHWEGDTLVVEVTNFNGKPWLGAARPPTQPPQTSSDTLRIVERWSRPDGQTLEFQAVVEDPKMLTSPWTGPVHRRGMLPYDTIQEALCFEDPELYARHREYAAATAGRRTAAPGPGRGGRAARGGVR
jgi:hypothetical protein